MTPGCYQQEEIFFRLSVVRDYQLFLQMQRLFVTITRAKELFQLQFVASKLNQ